MTPEQLLLEHGDFRDQKRPDPSTKDASPTRVDPLDPFYERLSLKPALEAIVERVTRRIKPR